MVEVYDWSNSLHQKLGRAIFTEKLRLEAEVKKYEKKWIDAGFSDFSLLSQSSKEFKAYLAFKRKYERAGETERRLIKLQDTPNRPYFLWHLWFKDVFDRGGFDIFIGNPPYIQLQKLGAETAEYEKAGFETFARTGDIYCLFYELGSKLLKLNGTLCFITSNKFMRANYGKGLRELLWKNNISEIVDFGELPVFAAAATFPVVVNIQKTENRKSVRFTQIKTLDFDSLSDVVDANSVQLSSAAFTGENWTLGDVKITELTEKINSIGTPLKDYLVDCQIRAGVKAGFNKAFIINEKQRRDLIESDAKSAEIIFPYLAGDDVRKYHLKNEKPKFIIFTRRGIDIEKYKAVKTYLEEFKDRLTPGIVGGRKPGTYKWFEIQDTVAFYKLFESPKIIYPDIALEPRFHIDYQNYYIDMTAFIIPTDDKFLLGLLNSKLIWFYLKSICSVLGDAENRGRLRLKRFYLENLPIKSISKEKQKPFTIFVDYLIFLHDKTKPSVNSFADNKAIATVFEDVLNMMVYELYFEEHLKENEIDVLQFVDTEKVFRDISELNDDAEKAAIIGKAYSWLQASDNPIRNRITLANIRSRDIIRKINSSTH